jgi:hypothetical protein
MSLSDRQRQFEDAVRDHYGVTGRTKFNRAFGVSNSAKVIEGGLQLGVANLDRFDPETDQFLMGCVIRFPPEDEVFFAIQVRTGLPAMVARLNGMRARGEATRGRTEAEAETGDETPAIPEDIHYSHRNNLVVACLARDGMIYLRNKGFWDSLDFDLSVAAPGIPVDSMAVSLYPPAASARRSLLAREFVGYLGRFIGRDKVHELAVWRDERAVGPLMRREPKTIPVADIRAGIEALGGHYVDELVERYHTALNFHPTKHFVILAGLSGTGKTQLALKYARTVHGIATNTDADPLLYVCPVRPEWTDPTGLTGYYDVLSNRYVVPPFLEAVLVATAWSDSPVFVVLDEMNLARVEYYFSDVLSAIETGVPLQLHSSAVPLEGSTGGEIRAEILLPANLFITGTINVDETTNPVSDKVLDRASLIDMSAVDLPGFLMKLTGDSPDLEVSAGICGPVLIRLHGLLAPHRLAFGYRLAEEFIRYHAFAVTTAGRSSDQVIGEAISQKILVRLRGTEAQRPLLETLLSALAPWPRSAAVIERLAADLDETGSFQNTR